MKYRRSLIHFTQKYDVTQATVKYKTNRQYIYRWFQRFNGSIEFLRDRSIRPHHPNQYTPEEIALISRIRKRNPDAVLSSSRSNSYYQAILALFLVSIVSYVGRGWWQ